MGGETSAARGSETGNRIGNDQFLAIRKASQLKRGGRQTRKL